MSINLDRTAKVDIIRATSTVSRRSFGSLMIAAYHTAWLDRVRSYTRASDMLDDGFTEDDAAYKAAVRAFQQSPRGIDLVKIGRRSGTPTQTIVFTVGTVEEGWEFSVTIGGETASYTAGAGDADTDVALGLVAAINGLTVAVTATDNLDGTFDVVADVAGTWFPYEDIDARLSVEDTTAEPGTTLATDLGNIQDEDANFFGLVVADAQSEPQISAIASWAETEQSIMYFGQTMDSAVKDSGSSDVASTLKSTGYNYTHLRWTHSNAEFQDAAVASKIMSFGPGESHIHYKTLAGCTASKLTQTQIQNMLGPRNDAAQGKLVGVYVEHVPTGTKSGEARTLGSYVSSGEWYDVIAGLIKLEALITERVFNIQINEPKVPYTQKGIETLAGAVRGALRDMAIDIPFVVSDSIKVNTKAVEDVSDADKQARYYDGITFDARLQGAIIWTDIEGTVRP